MEHWFSIEHMKVPQTAWDYWFTLKGSKKSFPAQLPFPGDGIWGFMHAKPALCHHTVSLPACQGFVFLLFLHSLTQNFSVYASLPPLQEFTLILYSQELHCMEPALHIGWLTKFWHQPRRAMLFCAPAGCLKGKPVNKNLKNDLTDKGGAS